MVDISLDAFLGACFCRSKSAVEIHTLLDIQDICRHLYRLQMEKHHIKMKTWLEKIELMMM